MPGQRRQRETQDLPRYCPLCRTHLPDGDTSPCPECDRPFDPDDPGTTSVHAKAFCKACGYDLVGAGAGACPECGEAYDPLDPDTYARTDTPPHVRRDRLFRVLAATALLLGVGFLADQTIIPRPAIRTGGQWVWTTWMWLDEPYGSLDVPAPGNTTISIRLWAGEVTGLTATRPAPGDALDRRTLYTVTRDGDTWTLDVPAAATRRSVEGFDRDIVEGGVYWGDLLLAFNTTRTTSEVVGVRITDAQRRLNEEPFSATGEGVDILQALIDAYRLTVEPGVTYDDPEHVWLQDEGGVLRRVTVEEAQAQGFDTPLISGSRINRITPRLR